MAGLNLRKEKVGLVLKKRGLIDVSARVGFAVDASGSMARLYASGVVQDAVERFLAVASRMDDDGQLDVWPFDHGTEQAPAATERNFAGYVNRAIPFRRWGGGTAYAPPIEAALDHWFPPKRRGFFGAVFGSGGRRPGRPAVLVVMTDGDNQHDDKDALRARLREIEGERVPLYIAFIGLGHPDAFGFIRDASWEHSNVGWMPMGDLSRMTDDDLYERLVDEELAAWLKADRWKGGDAIPGGGDTGSFGSHHPQDAAPCAPSGGDGACGGDGGGGGGE